ncbi:hypothetical protein LA52FAK_45640 [Desulforhopalus sp. 52FAK]
MDFMGTVEVTPSLGASDHDVDDFLDFLGIDQGASFSGSLKGQALSDIGPVDIVVDEFNLSIGNRTLINKFVDIFMLVFFEDYSGFDQTRIHSLEGNMGFADSSMYWADTSWFDLIDSENLLFDGISPEGSIGIRMWDNRDRSIFMHMNLNPIEPSAPIPEPSTLLLLSVGLGGLIVSRCNAKK